MAKKSIVARQKKRERLVAKYAELRRQLKKEGKWLELDKLPKNASPVRLRNRCQITGRARGYFRKFGISRIMLRQMANEGLIPGITKASW